VSLLGALAAGKRTLWVATAISLLPAMQETADLYRQRHDGVEVLFNAGASGLLCQQLLRGAPADVFVSASPVEVDRLADAGMLVADTRRSFATNSIVVLVPAGAKPPGSVKELTGSDYSRIAMGNPRSAPVGRYAKRGLEMLGLYERLEPRLVLGENARQVLEYVARGEVEAGLLYHSDARIVGPRVVVGPKLPGDPDAPIRYQSAVLDDAAESDLARQFVELLVSAEGQAILERHGFQAQ
jgi:molybdate transport system substrate-binding protein